MDGYAFFWLHVPGITPGVAWTLFHVLFLSGIVVDTRYYIRDIIFLFSGSMFRDSLQWLGHGFKRYLLLFAVVASGTVCWDRKRQGYDNKI